MTATNTKVRVENMVWSSGREVPNQFIIYSDDGVRFQSYRSIVIYIDNTGNVFLDKETWNYSRTTSKYRNNFLRMGTEEIKEAIRDGRFKLVNLNW